MRKFNEFPPVIPMNSPSQPASLGNAFPVDIDISANVAVGKVAMECKQPQPSKKRQGSDRL